MRDRARQTADGHSLARYSLLQAVKTDRSVVMILAMWKACWEKEPTRARKLYFFAMAEDDTQAVHLFHQEPPAHVEELVSRCFGGAVSFLNTHTRTLHLQTRTCKHAHCTLAHTHTRTLHTRTHLHTRTLAHTHTVVTVFHSPFAFSSVRSSRSSTNGLPWSRFTCSWPRF